MTSTVRPSPQRRLILLFVLVLVVPAAAVVWLGFEALRDDRARNLREAEERLTRSAAQAASGVDRAVAATEVRLYTAPDSLKPDLDEGSWLVSWPRIDEQEADEVFAAGEFLEFNRRDLGGAESAYRELALSGEATVRAGALLRMARVQRKAGDRRAALATLTTLGTLGSVRTAGLPADLMADLAQLDLSERTSPGQRESHAAALLDDLLRGRWPLDPNTWRHYVDTVSLVKKERPPVKTLAAAAAVLRTIWQRFSEPAPSASASGRELVQTGDGSLAVLWRRTESHFVALAAGPAFQARYWFSPLLIDDDSRIRLGLIDEHGQRVWGDGPVGVQSKTVRRAQVPGGLGWTSFAEEATPGAIAADASPRQRVLIAAIVLVVSIALAGGYFVTRAVSRELAAARLQSDFVAAVSHEFRTPLTSLRQFTDLLNASVEPGADKRRSFHQAQARATDRLQRLVESLLDFGRMEAGARTYELVQIPVNTWLTGVTAEFRRDALPQDFILDASVDEGTGFLVADRHALSFALWNLLDNAVKYSAESRRISLHAASLNGQLSIAVRDYGLGIPRSEQRSVFNKFVRGAASLKLGIRGTGLGLAIVERIVAAHGGRVDLTSVEGAGSTFTIVLPQPVSESHHSNKAADPYSHGAHSHR